MPGNDIERVIQLAYFAVCDRDQKKRFNWTSAINFLKSNEYREILKVRGRDLLFSLKGFDYLNPDGLIWLLSMGDYLITKENSLWLQLPENRDQLRDLKSWGFPSIAMERFSIINIFSLDEVTPRDLPESMRFFKVNLSLLAKIMTEIDALFGNADFLRKIGVSPIAEIAMEFLPPFLRTIQETTKNIVQHSADSLDQGSGYFVIVPVGKTWVRLCVADAGRGYLSSLLCKGIRVDNDFDAIKNAFLFRYGAEQGEGLFRVVQFVSRLGGVIRIRSGNGDGFLHLEHSLLNDEDARYLIEKQIKQVRQQFHFPGVQLQIDLRTINR